MISCKTFHSAMMVMVTAALACAPAATDNSTDARASDAGHATGSAPSEAGHGGETGTSPSEAGSGSGSSSGTGSGGDSGGPAVESGAPPLDSGKHTSCPTAKFNLAPPISLACGANPQGFAVADMNGDGFDDIVVGNTFDAVPPDNSPDIGVFISNGAAGTFKAQAKYPYDTGLEEAPFQIVLAEFAGNKGKADAVVCDNYCTFVPNDGSGGLGAAVIIPATMSILGPTGLVTADFNGDGKPDFAVAQTENDSQIYVALNAGGSFPAASQVPAPSVPTFMAVGDIDGKNGPDLISYNNTVIVSVFLNNGHGGFAAPTMTSPLDNNPQDNYPGLAVVDLNGDGKADVIANDAANVFVLISNGDGTFKTPVIYQTTFTSGNGVMTALDINGDGFTDFIIADGDPGGTGDVNVFFGDGTGVLGTPVVYGAGSPANGLSAIRAGNFQGTGLLGLATPVNAGQSSVDSTIAVLLPTCN
jgi:hypothetical protein